MNDKIKEELQGLTHEGLIYVILDMVDEIDECALSNGGVIGNIGEYVYRDMRGEIDELTGKQGLSAGEAFVGTALDNYLRGLDESDIAERIARF